MSQRVKIKVRANQQVHFPGLCVNCAQPAAEWMGLRKRIGRTTRLLDVPLCTDCQRQMTRLSGEEERLQKLGRLVASLAFLLTFAIILLLTPAQLSLMLRALIALLSALLATELVFLYFRRARRRAALPEKRKIRAAAEIADFSWRATTFEFANEAFYERFVVLNEPVLMDV